jgi:hypothetical protein
VVMLEDRVSRWTLMRLNRAAGTRLSAKPWLLEWLVPNPNGSPHSGFFRATRPALLHSFHAWEQGLLPILRRPRMNKKMAAKEPTNSQHRGHVSYFPGNPILNIRETEAEKRKLFMGWLPGLSRGLKLQSVASKVANLAATRNFEIS